MVCHWRVAFSWQQIVQARCFAQHYAPEEPLSQLSTPRLERVQSRQDQCHHVVWHSKLVIFCITLYWCLSKSMSCFVGPPKPKPKAMKSLNIGQALVSERRKLWQMDGSVSPSSVDSANMNEQERLADFDSAEELDDTHSASARKVCTRLMYQQQQHYILIGRLSSA